MLASEPPHLRRKNHLGAAPEGGRYNIGSEPSALKTPAVFAHSITV
jgi:hypothetical protein